MPSRPRISCLPDFEGSDALYKRLRADEFEIRVLNLWSDGDIDAPLEGTLRIVDLNNLQEKPSYTA